MSNNTLLNFIEKQEILDNLNVTLKKMYEDDEEFNSNEAIDLLTEKTYNVMEYMEHVQSNLASDPGILKVAENYDVPTEQVINDVAEIMLMSTVARQAIVLEQLDNEE